MLESLFSFRGRISRLQYFGWGLALGLAITVLAIPLVIAMVASHAAVPAAVGLIVLIVAPPFLWASFALQAKRFRDIGWNPVIIIPGWIAIQAVDMLFAMAAPSQAIGIGHTHTMFGGLVNLFMGGCLLFWPGRPEDDTPSVVESDWSRPPVPELAARPTRMSPARPAVAPRAATWSGGPQQTGFGRRGL